MDMPAQLIAQTYDHVPYDSKPFAQSHPARLAARARLFGLTPPDVATARVLEIGCASGGNLIPMAMAYPKARFVGIDVSATQIADGRARIGRLGLSNIELRQQSIAEISERDGAFDFIVCHGVYSWVPAEVRAAILRTTHDNLTGHGVAYISYNVFPGWRLRGTLRDAMLFHIDSETDPRRKIARAREFLNQLAEITDAASPYGQMLRQEARALAGMGDHYLFHEFLELDNAPCYVTDFLVRVRNARLEYLTEANLNITIAESFGESTGKLLRDLSGNALDRMEQYIDFLTGRTFRQSLLVRDTQASKIQRQLSQERLAGLHLSANLEVRDDGAGTVFNDHSGRTLTTQSRFVRTALAHLAGIYPQTQTPEALAIWAAEVNGCAAATGQEDGELRDALFKMILTGMVEMATEPITAAGAAPEKPLATALARADGRDRRGWTSNGQHEVVPLSIVAHAILPLLDGTHDHGSLEGAVAKAVSNDMIVLQREGKRLDDPAEIDDAVREHVLASLTQLAKAGLLVDRAA